MGEFGAAFGQAIRLIVDLDADLVEIVLLSLRISLIAVLLSAFIGLPAGAALAVFRFPGRRILIVLTNSLMGLPPVVVALCVYLLLSRSGPLGVLDLLFKPQAMIIAQFLLVLPIVTALARQVFEDLWLEYREQLRSLGVSSSRAVVTLLWDARFSLLPAVLAGFGRASAEVGAVMIVGGNIAHVTRVMTTSIALETSKGDLALALGLGLILLVLNVVVNATVAVLKGTAQSASGAPSAMAGTS